MWSRRTAFYPKFKYIWYNLYSVMSLSSYRMHRIYLAATMNYGLGSDDPEELAYYNKIKKEMDDMKKEPFKRGIPLNWDNLKVIDKWI